MAVSFTDGVKPHLAVKHFDYNDMPPRALAHRTIIVTCAEDVEVF